MDIPKQQLQACSAGWETDDVVLITTKELTTTGGTLWGAAMRCRDFLAAAAADVGLHKQGVRVLELGAGCGTLGLTVARNTPGAAEVCLTERAHGGALQHLRTNVQANAHLPNMAAVTCCACDWTHFMQPDVLKAAQLAAGAAGSCSAATSNRLDSSCHCQGGGSSTSSTSSCSAVSQQELLDLHKLLTTPWDIIIGSDLVYDTAGAHALPRVLATLMRARQQQQQQQQSELPEPAGPACFYYAHTKHRYDAMDVLLFERLAAEGLAVEEVVEPGGELPPPSPPPFSSLYPDLRCGVFKVSAV